MTPGHPEHFLTEGIETTTGPLGQGFANGVGFAIAERFLAERFNRPHHAIVDHCVYAICSDGDLMEGVSNEAASIAGQLGLGKLVYFYDDNRITIDGTTRSPSRPRTRARASRRRAGTSSGRRRGGRRRARAGDRRGEGGDERPSLIVVRSHIAYPAPNAIDTAKSHGSPLGEDEVRAAKEVLGWDPDQHFHVPRGLRAHGRAPGRDRAGAGVEAALRALGRGVPALREEWDAEHTGKPRPGWVEALPEFAAGEDMATRDAGKKVMQAFRPFTPTMVGGAADLVESTKTEFEGGGLFSRRTPAGTSRSASASTRWARS